MDAHPITHLPLGYRLIQPQDTMFILKDVKSLHSCLAPMGILYDFLGVISIEKEVNK